MAHSYAATSYSISFVNSGFCSSSNSHSRALSLRFAPLQSRKLRLKGTERRLRFDPVKAVHLDHEKSYRKGYWSIRDDLAIPSTPYIPMAEVYAGQGPPAMVIEGLRSLTGQLFQHRIVRCGGEVNDDMANLLVAQLLLLDALDPNKDITMYINSPGGSVTAGLAIYDTMRHVRPNVSTVCVGLAASMGAFLLSGGTKGKRFSLPSARIMIHQPLGGAQGRETEIEAQVNEMMHHKANLNTHIALNCGRELLKVYQDTDRDYFMSAKEAKEYGLIDDVIINPIKALQPLTAKSP